MDCIAAAAAILFAVGCGQGSSNPEPARIFWKTQVRINGIEVSADSILERSRLAKGNNHRLGKYFSKCDSKSAIKIGFLGGSITGGASASDSLHRYSRLLGEFLSKSWRNTRFEEINAGIGATNSRFACSRAEDDLFAFAPDMIILELAVNDDPADSPATTEVFEGLVRKCLAFSPDVPVVLFQTMNRDGDTLNQHIQRKIADHYSLPVVSYNSALRPLVVDGRIPWDTLSRDDVHPNDIGHRICAYLLYDFIVSEHGEYGRRPDSNHAIPPFLVSDLYQGAGILKSSESGFTMIADSRWLKSDDAKGRTGFTSRAKGDALLFSIPAREVTFQFPYSKDLHGMVEVSLDGVITDTIGNHFEEDWGGGYLKGERIYLSDSAGTHTIALRNLSDSLFNLQYVLFAP